MTSKTSSVRSIRLPNEVWARLEQEAAPDVFEFVQSQRIDRFKVEGGEIVEHRVLTPADTDWPLRVQK